MASRERRAYWCDEISAQWSATTFEWLAQEPREGKVVMRSFAGSLSAECEHASARISRPKRMLDQAPDCYNLVLHLDGHGRYQQAGREIMAGKGDLVLMESTEPFDMLLSRHHVRSWVLPRAALEPLLADPASAINAYIPGNSVLGGILGSYLHTLWQSFGRVDSATAGALNNHLHYLVALASGGKLAELDDRWQQCAPSVAQAKQLRLDRSTEAMRRQTLLRERYGLTPAEAAFAMEIVKGDGRSAAAKRRGISDSTAHTHLNSIFEKTGVNRQAELVRLVMETWLNG